MDKEELEHYHKAGEIAKQVMSFAKDIVKPGMKLLDIAEQIEGKTIELGGKPAFPTNLSISDIAAHYTPSHDDASVAQGLLKVDFGVQVEGCTIDCAFSVDCEGKWKVLIDASHEALEAALKVVRKGVSIGEIGKSIQEVIVAKGFSPIKNLSGHEITQYNLHAGLTIPNVDTGSKVVLDEGVYAIEPFATTGSGSVYDGKPSGIYQLLSRKAIRASLARDILNFVEEEYGTLPFCVRWIVKKFGARALFSLQLMQQQGILHQYPQLVEKGHGVVSQTETTVIITKDGVEVMV